MKRLFVLTFISFLLFYSCTSHDGDLSVYTVSNADFNQILKIDGFVEPVKSTTLFCPSGIEGNIIFLLEDGTRVEQGDTVCILEAKELETSYNQMLIDMETERASLNKIRADLDMQYALLEAQVRNNEADTKIAHLDSFQIEYATPSQKRIKELELEKVSIEKIKFEKKLKALGVIQQSDIKKAELKILRMETRAGSMKERLESLIIKAPQNGLVTRTMNFITGNKNQMGDVVWDNMPIVMIPEMADMKVSIAASERDFKSLNVNDSVYYGFDAMPGNVGWGKILKKSPVGKPVKEKSKVKVFEVEASIDSVLEMPDPGFSVVCNIVQKTVKDTLVIPQVAVFEVDSMKFVYVKRGKQYEMRQIQTSLSFPKEAVISAGLKRGEVISLSKPDLSKVKKERILLPVEPSDSIIPNNKDQVVKR
ncbi:MAG: efflux RND transporter periplasmic adaptor subunit [Dysgonamonadaceae bacterium]|nr:efflux RND transporter periplasmic adaptor subunit [Dysgonamonadaceae bacterium]